MQQEEADCGNNQIPFDCKQALTRQVFFLIPLILILPLRFGILGVLYAGPVADFSAFILPATRKYLTAYIDKNNCPIRIDDRIAAVQKNKDGYAALH